MIWIYHVLVSTGFVLVLPLLPLVWLLSGKRRANLLQRLGWWTGIQKRSGSRKPIWIHALSVGEVTSALPLVLALNRQFPETPIVFTASTRTGYDTAHTLFFRADSPLVSQIAYFPFDLPWAVDRVRRDRSGMDMSGGNRSMARIPLCHATEKYSGDTGECPDVP